MLKKLVKLYLDNIVVLRKGTIIEQGKHEELLAKKGEYFKLVTMQTLQ